MSVPVRLGLVAASTPTLAMSSVVAIRRVGSTAGLAEVRLPGVLELIGSSAGHRGPWQRPSGELDLTHWQFINPELTVNCTGWPPVNDLPRRGDNDLRRWRRPGYIGPVRPRRLSQRRRPVPACGPAPRLIRRPGSRTLLSLA